MTMRASTKTIPQSQARAQATVVGHSGRGESPRLAPVQPTHVGLGKPRLVVAVARPASAPAPPRELLGQVISGRYRIDSLVAAGGMGAVYRGEHLRMRKQVAIKILHAEIEGLPELVERFEREAIAGAHVNHPNVASATDFGELADGSFFLVLEYVRGTTLSDVIQRGPLAANRAVAIARQIASALQAVHELGIVHRDVKPRNVMLVEGPGELAKLIDFGLAKIAVEHFSANEPPARVLTGAGVVMGTLAYLAPEAARGMDAVDARADLYALGVMLYEMLAGRRPFDGVADGLDMADAFRKQCQEPPPAIAVRSPRVVVAPALEAVVMRLLERSKERRFQSAAEVVAALDRAMAPEAARPTPAPMVTAQAIVASSRPNVPRAAPATRSRGTRWAIVSAALVLLVGAIVAGHFLSAAANATAERDDRPTRVDRERRRTGSRDGSRTGARGAGSAGRVAEPFRVVDEDPDMQSGRGEELADGAERELAPPYEHVELLPPWRQ
jgi:hypothetical protein